jgi:thiol-disulfide isomerase/thioredoxin
LYSLQPASSHRHSQRKQQNPQSPTTSKICAQSLQSSALPPRPNSRPTSTPFLLANQRSNSPTRLLTSLPKATPAKNTLAQALTESPVAPKNDHVPEPYMEVAKLVRYEQLTTSLKDPQFDKASQLLEANDADIEKADFTLKDLRGKKYTLSELRGKIVLVNFWATWCPPCRSEMPNLDAIYTHFQSQGLEILSISVDEDPLKMTSFMSGTNYHPPVLYDAGGKVAKQFHVDGLPRTFVFNRDGKLIAQSIDMRTQRQFFNMLAAAGLHP